MNIFQKWRIQKNRRNMITAIANYNEALKQLSEAATLIGEAAQRGGVMTEGISNAIKEIEEIAKTSSISAEDFKRGGGDRGTK